MKEIIIEGVITVPANVTSYQLADEFAEWLKSKGYALAGMPELNNTTNDQT